VNDDLMLFTAGLVTHGSTLMVFAIESGDQQEHHHR